MAHYSNGMEILLEFAFDKLSNQLFTVEVASRSQLSAAW